jgi:hypothetical protein
MLAMMQQRVRAVRREYGLTSTTIGHFLQDRSSSIGALSQRLLGTFSALLDYLTHHEILLETIV